MTFFSFSDGRFEFIEILMLNLLKESERRLLPGLSLDQPEGDKE